jgi:hypothetical protein
MVGPIEALMLLMRAEMVVGFMEVVRRDSRMSVSEDERSEVSNAGGCACDGDLSASGDMVGIEGGRSSASRDCRSDFNLESCVSRTKLMALDADIPSDLRF